MTNKQLFVYTRKGKDESVHSIDMQLSAAEKLKNDLGFDEIIHLNEDEQNYTKMIDRDKSRELISFIENGQCKHLFFYEWTRITRDEIEAMLFRKFLIENNVLVYTSLSNPSINLKVDNELMDLIIGADSQFERSKMIAKMKDGLKNKQMAQTSTI
jgi:DNA invertase Pin-like site-specific DNA recombinase